MPLSPGRGYKNIIMKKITLSLAKVMRFYTIASPDSRRLLEALIGFEVFLQKEKKKRWKITSIEQAFRKVHRPKIDFSVFPEDLREHMEAYYNAIVIVEAVNEGNPKWDDINDHKWAPSFNISNSQIEHCSSFSWTDLPSSCTGSRFFLRTREKCDYVAQQFPEVWKNILLK